MSTYNVDPAHSSASFSVKHMMIATVRGTFSKLTGTLELDPANVASSKVTAAIEADSIGTGVADRDNHLRSADFFDVATHPAIEFQSTSVEPLGGDEAKLTGDLTLHGVTKPVTLTVEGSTTELKDPMGNQRIAFSATGKIKRSDFGLHFNIPLDSGGVVIGDDISLTLDVQFVKA